MYRVILYDRYSINRVIAQRCISKKLGAHTVEGLSGCKYTRLVTNKVVTLVLLLGTCTKVLEGGKLNSMSAPT